MLAEKVLGHFVNMSSCQNAILSMCHIVNLPFCWHVIFSACNFCQNAILVMCHIVNLPPCQHVIFSACILAKCHFGNVSYCQLAILSTCHFFSMHLLLKCHFVNVLFGQHVIISTCLFINVILPMTFCDPPKKTTLFDLMKSSPKTYSGNTKGGSITIPLTSCLTRLDLSVLQIKTKIVSCHTADSKPVKQEANSTVLLPPLVFILCLTNTLKP